MQLGNKVVVITGAARGIGRAMALAFAERGAHIAAERMRHAVRAGRSLGS